jgi:hypothetical protein
MDQIQIENFRKTMFNYINSLENAHPNHKIDTLKNMFDYVILIKDILFYQDLHKDICESIKNRLRDTHYRLRVPWASNYHLILFGYSLIEDINGDDLRNINDNDLPELI